MTETRRELQALLAEVEEYYAYAEQLIAQASAQVAYIKSTLPTLTSADELKSAIKSAGSEGTVRQRQAAGVAVAKSAASLRGRIQQTGSAPPALQGYGSALQDERRAQWRCL